jgi:hypothetical protein
MRLLQSFKLTSGVFRLQLVEKVKAGVEFRNVQSLNRTLFGGNLRRSNFKDSRRQRAAQEQTDYDSVRSKWHFENSSR